MDRRYIIVDVNDEVVGVRLKSEMLHPQDIYRVSAVWVVNSLGQFLVARRSLADSSEAGKWGPSVAGTIEQGEGYEDNARKELGEEIGLIDAGLVKGPKAFVDGRRRYFVQWFFTRSDLRREDFILQPEEVAAVKWMRADDLAEDFAQYPRDYIAGFEQSLTVMSYMQHAGYSAKWTSARGDSWRIAL